MREMQVPVGIFQRINFSINWILTVNVTEELFWIFPTRRCHLHFLVMLGSFSQDFHSFSKVELFLKVFRGFCFSLGDYFPSHGVLNFTILPFWLRFPATPTTLVRMNVDCFHMKSILNRLNCASTRYQSFHQTFPEQSAGFGSLVFEIPKLK